jgi:hypothetical protein
MYRATNRHGPFNGSQLSLNIPDRLHARGYNPPPNNQTKEISMANAQRGNPQTTSNPEHRHGP